MYSNSLVFRRWGMVVAALESLWRLLSYNANSFQKVSTFTIRFFTNLKIGYWNKYVSLIFRRWAMFQTSFKADEVVSFWFLLQIRKNYVW